jgi:hypothetical protein
VHKIELIPVDGRGFHLSHVLAVLSACAIVEAAAAFELVVWIGGLVVAVAQFIWPAGDEEGCFCKI